MRQHSAQGQQRMLTDHY